MNQHQDMRFGIIRNKIEVEDKHLSLDGLNCPDCGQHTEAENGRRYCVNNKCNALILEG